MKILTLSLLLALSPVQNKPIMLRDTHASVWAKLGRPIRTLRSGAEEWTRKTATDEFRVDVDYYLDSTASKLHPAVRVESVNFWPDKRKPWDVLVRELDEAKIVCSKGCHVAAHSDVTGGPMSTEIIACPTMPGISAVPLERLPGPDDEACVYVWFESTTAKVDESTDWSSLEVMMLGVSLTKVDEAFLEHDPRAYFRKDFGVMTF